MELSRTLIFQDRKRATSFILLFGAIVLAFVMAPYWRLYESTAVKIAMFISTAVICGVWAFVSSGALEIPIRPERRTVALVFVLFALLFVINFLPLTSAIAWMGDEDYNLKITVFTAQLLKPALLIPLVAFAALFLFLAFKQPAWGFLLLVLGLVGIFVFYLDAALDEKYASAILRYPFFSRWFHALPPAAAGIFGQSFHEILYRLVPFVSAVGIAAFFATRFTDSPLWLKIIYGAAAGSMPLIYYYSSILYLEMPALLLMLVVFSRIESVLTGEWEDLKKNPAWYCLILIGFFKETVTPFLACLCLLRLVFFVKRHGFTGWRPRLSGLRPKVILREAGFYFCALFPIAFYIVNRIAFQVPRPFSFHPGNYLIPAAWGAFLYSLWEQFGVFCLFALAGLVVLIIKKKYVRFVFYAGILLTVPLFHIGDVLELAGYSRFNLFLAPVMLLATAEFLSLFTGKIKLFILPAAAAGLLAANLLLCPVNLDGTKRPYWGNTLIDTSEHYYPYPQALEWIKENHGQKKILFFNLTYYYYFDFYFSKLRWTPEYATVPWPKETPFRGDSRELQSLLDDARAKGFGVVVYHLQKDDSAEAIQKSVLGETRLFRTQAHSLLVIVL